MKKVFAKDLKFKRTNQNEEYCELELNGYSLEIGHNLNTNYYWLKNKTTNSDIPFETLRSLIIWINKMPERR